MTESVPVARTALMPHAFYSAWRCRSKKNAGTAGVVSLAKLCVDYVPDGRPRGDGREMSIMAMRSFSSYQQWKRLMPGTSIS